MKKLLSLLATITLTVTPVTSVIACTNKTSDGDNNATNSILKSPIFNLTADDLVKSAKAETLFGGHDNAVHDFMNYFAFQVSKQLSDTKSDLYQQFNAAVEADNTYINDEFINSVQTQYNSSRQYAISQWNEAVDAAKDDGKKWEETFRKALEKQLNRTFTKYQDAKDVYITNQMMKGTNNTSVIDSLLNAIYAIPQDNKVLTFDQIIQNFSGQILGLNQTIGGISFNLLNAWGANWVKDSGLDLVGELTKLLQGLAVEVANLSHPYFDSLSTYLIDFINATGGTNSPSSNTTAQLSNITWMTQSAFKSSVLGDPATWAKEIIARACSTYTTDYDSSGTPTSNYKPKIDGKGAGVAKFAAINSYVSLTDNSSISNNASTKGLFSNAQRYFANQYFNTKKPLAISEFIIKPLTSTNTLSTNINNAGYIADNVANQADVGSLYNFMNLFVNQGNWGGTSSTDNTKTMVSGSSDYSWDQLMNSGGSLSNWTNQAGKNYTWTDTFTSDFSLNQHTKLLTMDSISSDYSDILKYSVYDYLAKSSATEYTSNTSAPTVENDGSVTTNLSDQQKAITNWITSMNRRTSGTNNVYQVLNNTQGIISFVDTDGIHITRIEGYGLLKDANGLTSQTKLSTTSFVDGNQALINNYQAIESISRNLNNNSNSSVVKNAIKNQTYDYTNADTTSYYQYNNLNTSFGNKYLQFLANSSVLASIGITNTKEKYDLNGEVQSYLASAIPSSSATSTNMWISAWTYFKEILGLDDSELFDLIFPTSNATYDLFGIGAYATQTTIYTKYRQYILDVLNNVGNDISNSVEDAFENGWNTWAKSNNNVPIDNPENDYKPLKTLPVGYSDIENATYWDYQVASQKERS